VGSTINFVNGFNEIYFVATSTTFKIKRTTSVSNCLLDNVSVKEVGQNWTFGTGWSIEDGKAIAVNASNQSLSQSTSSVLLNKKYRISFDVEYISGSAKFQLVGAAAQDVATITSSGTKVIEVVSDANKTSYRVKGLTTGSGFNGSIDNVSIIEITDDTDLPRIDYTDGNGSLLLEPQSTNLLPYSEDFSQWTASSGVTITASQINELTGNNDASKIETNGTSGYQQILQTISATSGVNTFSVFAKKGTNDRISLRGLSGTDVRLIVDLTNGTFIGATNYLSRTIEDYGNDWYKISVTFTGANTNFYIYPQHLGIASAGYVYVYGAQLEQQSFATSYIPTNGEVNGVTRDADVCNNSGSSDLINSTEGVLYAEIAALADDLTFRGIALSDGTTDNRVMLRYRTTTNQINLFIKADGVLIVNSTKALTDITNYSKIAIKYKSGDIALWVDGQEAKTHTNTFTLIGLDRLNFDAGNGSDDFYGKVKSVAVFKEALTDAELQCLTS